MTQQYEKSDEQLLAAIFKNDRPALREAAMMAARRRFDAPLQGRVPLPQALHGHGLEEDVLQRAWELVWRAGPAGFDPARGSALAYLEGHARNARRDVCEEHAPPGMRRRPGNDAHGEPVPWRPAVPIDTTVNVTVSETESDPGQPVAALVVEDVGFEHTLNRVVVEQYQRTAAVSNPLVADLLERMRRDFGLAEAAVDLAVSRHVARRALDRFALTLAA